MLSKRAKVTSDKPMYKEKIKTENGYVWRYDKESLNKRWEHKIEKLEHLEKNVEKLRDAYNKSLSSDTLRERAVGAIIAILDLTAMRVGNEDSAKNAKTYGATTLLKKHLTISGNKAIFDFVGKDNVKQHVELKNAKVVKVLKELIKDKTPGDFIFEVNNNKIWDRAINRYLKDFDISAKDLRGFEANNIMKKKLKNNNFGKALEETAKQVGHDPATLKNQYLDPKLVQQYNKKASLSKRAFTDKDMQELDSIQNKYNGPVSQVVNQQPIIHHDHATTAIHVQPAQQHKLNLSSLHIGPGVEVNELILAAWKSLLPFLPSGAMMTSGVRDVEDQERIINEYWGKLPERLHRQYPNLDNNQKLMALKHFGYQIASPDTSDHIKGRAFDVSGASLGEIAKAIDFVSHSKIPVKFKAPIKEGRQNAVHVVVESAAYNPDIVGEVYNESENKLASSKQLSKRAASDLNSPMTAEDVENKSKMDETKAKTLAQSDAVEFLENYGDSYPQFVQTAFDHWKLPPFIFFISELDKKYPDKSKEFAKNVAQTNALYFLSGGNGLNLSKKYPEFSDIAAMKILNSSHIKADLEYIFQEYGRRDGLSVYDNFPEKYKMDLLKKLVEHLPNHYRSAVDPKDKKFWALTKEWLINYAIPRNSAVFVAEYFGDLIQNSYFHDVAEILVKTIIEKRQYHAYFQLGLEKNKKYNEQTKEIILNASPLLYFQYHVDKIPDFKQYKEQLGEKLLERDSDNFKDLDLFNDPDMHNFVERFARKLDTNDYFAYYQLQNVKSLLNLTKLRAKDIADSGQYSLYVKYGLASIPELKDITKTISFIDSSLKDIFKLNTNIEENNFISLTASNFQTAQRNPESKQATLFDFAVNNSIVGEKNTAEDAILGSIYHQTTEGAHEVGLKGLTKSFGLVSFPEDDTMFLEEIQSDLPGILQQLKQDEDEQKKIIEQYGQDNYFKFIQNATEHAAVYPYIIIEKAANFAKTNNIKNLKISGAQDVASFANIANTTKLEKIYSKVPSKLGFKLEKGTWVYDGDMGTLANKAKEAEQNVIQELRKDSTPKKELSSREPKKPRLLNIEFAKPLIDNILGTRANQLTLSEDMNATLRSLDALHKNKIITTKEKNEVISLLTKNIKAYLVNLIEKYAFTFNYGDTMKKKAFKISAREEMLTEKEQDEGREELSLDKIKQDMGRGIDDQPGDYFEKNQKFLKRDERPKYEEVDASEQQAKALIKKTPEDFFYRGLHRKYPQYERAALNRIVENNAKFFFIFKYDQVARFSDMMQNVAEKLSQQDAKAFFYYKLHRIYPELGRGAIINLIDNTPSEFFTLGLQTDYPDYQAAANAARNLKNPNVQQVEVVSLSGGLSKRFKKADKLDNSQAPIEEIKDSDIVTDMLPTTKLKKKKEILSVEPTKPTEQLPELSLEQVKNIAQTRPMVYVLNLIEKYPQFKDIAAREMAYDYPGVFFVEGFDKMNEFKDLVPIAAEGIAKNSPMTFFIKDLHNNPETKKFTMLALENLAKDDPKSFLNSKFSKMEEYKSLLPIAQESIKKHKLAKRN